MLNMDFLSLYLSGLGHPSYVDKSRSTELKELNKMAQVPLLYSDPL